MNVPEHGGNSFRFGAKLDFSANINPLGIPERAAAALADPACWQQYPDPDCTALIRKISAYEKIPAGRIVCGNGADDLIFRIVQGLRPRKALICAPTFSEYKRALLNNGCSVSEYILSPDNNFGLTTEFAEHIMADTDIVFLCSPNNPTGEMITPFTLSTISERCRRNGAVLVCDECFMELAKSHDRYSAKCLSGEHIIVLKAFTKTYAMAGLRLGYALFSSEKTADRVRRTGQYWSVSGPAQTAGAAALDDGIYLKRSRRIIADERKYLTEQLTRMGIMVFPSHANFLLFRCELPMDELLLKRGILIRNCSNFTGLGEGYFRIAVLRRADNRRLIREIERILHG